MKLKQLPSPDYADLLFAVEPDVDVLHQQAMSLGVCLAWANDFLVDVLSGVDLSTDAKRHKSCKEGMADSWGVVDTPSAISTLDWLLQEGHRAHWAATLECLRNAQVAHNLEDDTRASAFAFHLREATPRLIELGLAEDQQDIERLGIDAWDHGRIIHVARESYYLGYLTEEQAWPYILRAFSQAQQRYRTWVDYARSYLMGRYAWGGLDTEKNMGTGMHKAVTSMLRYRYSTWNCYPLNPAFEAEYERQRHKLVGNIEPVKSALSASASSIPTPETAPPARSTVVIDPRAEKAARKAMKAQRPSLIRRLLDIPIIGHYLATAIGLVVPFVVLVCLGALFQGVLHIPINEGRTGKLFFVPGLAVLVFLWNQYLARKQQLRITLPIIPIPLTWIAVFFFVVGTLAAFF